eukprot:SAG31_NODE_424_length_15826_cov_4.954664_17_plen_79_part_00
MWQVTKVQNRVVIENSKGRLAEEEIERMVAEAGKFAAEVRHTAKIVCLCDWTTSCSTYIDFALADRCQWSCGVLKVQN